ncbi:cbb3-type cytochrome c oxidase subunit II [Deinococcus aluminii]|uniref:Cytochrome c domain-containing protein n=1 Tax=Deinococcus aluminii TaxID=1656885 RepID=A0ABP9XF71_9DEIO
MTEPPQNAPLREVPPQGTPQGQRFLERFETVVLLGGIGSFVLSVVALGLAPGAALKAKIERTTPAASRDYTAQELRGRELYMRDGCAYCHTQFVRPTVSDVRYFGVASEAWEYRNDYPHLWGTRRIGPDLSREAGKRPDGWQYAHLYNPRSTVPQSIMPAFPWYFTHAADGSALPNADGEAIVAYLNTLGRAMQIAGPQPDTLTNQQMHEGHP